MHNGTRAVVAQTVVSQGLRPFRQCFEFGLRTFQKHPFLVKSISSGIGFAVGDSLTQLATRREGEAYDWNRTLLMGGAGVAVAGPLGFLLIVWMEGHILPQSPTSRLAITSKVTLDQVLGGLLWQAALLSIHEPYRAAAMDLMLRSMKKVQKKFGEKSQIFKRIPM